MKLEEALNNAIAMREDFRHENFVEYYNNNEDLKVYWEEFWTLVISALEEYITN